MWPSTFMRLLPSPQRMKTILVSHTTSTCNPFKDNIHTNCTCRLTSCLTIHTKHGAVNTVSGKQLLSALMVIYIQRVESVLLFNARDVGTMHRVFTVSSQTSTVALPCRTVFLNLCETSAR